MAVFGLLVEDNKTSSIYLDRTNERLQGVNFLSNPFNGMINKLNHINNNINYATYIIKVKPIYYNFSMYGLLLGIVMYMLGGFTWWLLIPGTMILEHIFFTSRFYYYILYLGLKFNSYKGTVKYVNKDDIIDIIYFNKFAVDNGTS